ncbi:MAG: hypothetical protein ABJD07_08510 [Gemmatimonadaceae bacterium]
MRTIFDSMLARPPRDPLPASTPWWGVVIARVATLIARAGVAIAIGWAAQRAGAACAR